MALKMLVISTGNSGDISGGKVGENCRESVGNKPRTLGTKNATDNSRIAIT